MLHALRFTTACVGPGPSRVFHISDWRFPTWTIESFWVNPWGLDRFCQNCGLTLLRFDLLFIETHFQQATFGRNCVQNEIILNVFPGANDQNRLVLVRSMTMCGLEHLILRQETHSADVGWFVQNQVVIEPGQVAALKMTLAPAIANRNTGAVKSDTAKHTGWFEKYFQK